MPFSTSSSEIGKNIGLYEKRPNFIFYDKIPIAYTKDEWEKLCFVYMGRGESHFGVARLETTESTKFLCGFDIIAIDVFDSTYGVSVVVNNDTSPSVNFNQYVDYAIDKMCCGSYSIKPYVCNGELQYINVVVS